MFRSRLFLLVLGALLLFAAVFFGFKKVALSWPRPARFTTKLRTTRASASDLELAGELAGLPAGTTRYLTREDLSVLPQVTYTVADDANFKEPAKITGVELRELVQRLAQAPAEAMVTAVCDDLYKAHYPRMYLASHHPLLVLQVNGQPPAAWPKSSDGSGSAMGPYLISHPKFVPDPQVPASADEPQIPWGVVLLEFRNEKTVLDAIAPRGRYAAASTVQAGYRIARQNCFRCHDTGDKTAMKSGRPWEVLSAWASSSPSNFAAYVRNPKSKNPLAQMPGNPDFDDVTISALAEYFRGFNEPGQP